MTRYCHVSRGSRGNSKFDGKAGRRLGVTSEPSESVIVEICARLKAPSQSHKEISMGLLDSVLGAVTSNAQTGGGLQDLIGMAGQNPKLL